MANGLLIGSMLTLGGSLILQLVAVATPGWYITEYSSQGLFYIVVCPTDLPCETKSLPDTWERLSDYQKDIQRYFFANTILTSMLPLLFSGICALAMIVLLCDRTNRQERSSSSRIMVVVLLTISVVLQWQLTAGYANQNRAAAEFLDNDYFPWSLFLYGLASAASTAVTIMQLIILVRDTKDTHSQGHPLQSGVIQQGHVFQAMSYTGPAGQYQEQSQPGAQHGLYQTNGLKTNC